MRNESANEQKAVNEHVTRLVNASVLRLMQKMVDEFNEEERINRLIAKWIIPPLVAIGVVAAGYLIFGSKTESKNTEAQANNIPLIELPYPAPELKHQSGMRKVRIGPGTLNNEYAAYYELVSKRLVAIGNRYLTKHSVKGRRGEAIVSIPIKADGTLYLDEGGAKIEKSSGNLKMDELAIILISKAAPYPNFKKATEDRDEVRVIYTRMKIESGNNEESEK